MYSGKALNMPYALNVDKTPLEVAMELECTMLEL
jgi:hypothetical protein